MSQQIGRATGLGASRSESTRRPAWGEPEAPTIGEWLGFAADKMVEVYCGKVEVGQNIRTSLAQAVAEELRLPIERVRVTLGDTALTPFDIGTFGSRTTPITAALLHRVAASARELLIGRAAERWQVERPGSPRVAPAGSPKGSTDGPGTGGWWSGSSGSSHRYSQASSGRGGPGSDDGLAPR